MIFFPFSLILMISKVSIIITCVWNTEENIVPIHQDKYKKEIEETAVREKIILIFGISNKQVQNIICLAIVKFL